MESDLLKEQFMHAMFHFRKGMIGLFHVHEVNMTELGVLKGLAGHARGHGRGINVSAMQGHLHVTKAAISQSLGALEKKGCVIRETDPENRRKIVVTLTERGRQTLRDTERRTEQMMNKMFTRFGEENTRQFIAFIEQLSDISEEIKREALSEDHGGKPL